MSDSKYDVSQTESRKGGKRAGLKNHCKRFWWLHLIIFILISVMVILVTIFVGVKNIAQSKVNEANLKIQGVNILDSAPTDFTMQINSTISTDGTVKADIDSFLGNLTLTDVPNAEPFVQLDFPKTNADKFQKVNVSQHVTITNQKAFTAFNAAFFQNETLRVTIHGNTHATPAAMTKKYPIDFKKTVTFKGLNKLNGTKLENPKIAVGDNDGYPNFNATAVIINRSYYTIDIGNATFDNYGDNQFMGNLTIFDFVLRPGENKVGVSATLDQSVILGAATEKPYCETGKFPVELKAVKIENGGKEVPWLLEALSSANQTVDIDLVDVLSAALGSKYKLTCS